MPWRVPAVEKLLVGRTLDARLAARRPRPRRKAEPMGDNGYKVALVRGVVDEALLSLA